MCVCEVDLSSTEEERRRLSTPIRLRLEAVEMLRRGRVSCPTRLLLALAVS